MMSSWFAQYIYNSSFGMNFDGFVITIVPSVVFGLLMFCLFLWAAFHLTTDVIMAFRSMFGLGNKKKKGGS